MQNKIHQLTLVLRNFFIIENENKHQLSYQPNTLFRIGIEGRYNEKINDENFGNEKAYLTQIGINLEKVKKQAV